MKETMRDKALPPPEPNQTPKDHRVRNELLVMLIRLMPVLLIVLGVAAAVLLFLPIFGKPLISLTYKEETSVSDLLLTEVREICRLNTVEYHYKVVFPFDFDKPGVNEASILAKIKKHFSADLATILSPEEKLWLKAVNLAKSNGLNPYTPDYHFLVANVIIKGGFDLENNPPRLESKVNPDSQNTSKTAVLYLPPAIITSVVVEDPVRESYPFPDLALSPKGWKEIASFIQENYVNQSITDGLLEKARQRAEAWLKPLLIQAGYAEITVRSINP